MHSATRRAALADDLRLNVFPHAGRSRAGFLTIGAEVELIPVDEESGLPRPVLGDRSSVSLLRQLAAEHGWCETLSATSGVPSFHLPDGSCVTFEPGGQIEYSSRPCESASELLARLTWLTDALAAASARSGVELLSLGIDPRTPVECVPPQLGTRRYRRMLDYFSTIGPSGARMMRQTASVQVSVDGGADPPLTWRVLNAAAPYVAAIFANSPIYEGAPTGCRSYRRYVWDTLDPRRTGVRGVCGNAVAEYLDFALDAPAFRLEGEVEGCPSLGEALDAGRVTVDDWRAHLSTLFPEVRPRGYFEVRSADAISPYWYAAPIALVGGLAYDAVAAREAGELLGVPDPELLHRAGQSGLDDEAIARTAAELCEVALAGCARLGDRFIEGPDLERAEEFFARYTARGRTPADDVEAARR